MKVDGKALHTYSDVPWLWWHTPHTPARNGAAARACQGQGGSLPGVVKLAQPWEDREQPVTSRQGSPPGILKAAGVRVWASTASEGYTVKLIDSAWDKL